VAWGAELAVLARSGDFGKQVFVQVTLGVVERLAFLLLALNLGVDFVDDAGGFHEQRGLGEDEDGILHCLGERMLVVAATELLDEREHTVANDAQQRTTRNISSAGKCRNWLQRSSFLSISTLSRPVYLPAKSDTCPWPPNSARFCSVRSDSSNRRMNNR